MLKKVFVFFLCLCLCISVQAAECDIKIIDDTLYKQVLEKSSVSEDDINLYKRIFKAIRENDLEKADTFSSKLEGKALLGHVLAQKYINTSYNSSYGELKKWMAKYPELPQYAAVAELAKVKAPNYKKPNSKLEKKKIYASYKWYKDNYSQLKPADRKYVRGMVDDFLKAIRCTDNKRAMEIMHDYKFRMTIPDRHYDGMSAVLSASYFYEGEYQNALKWTTKAIRRSKDPTAAWFGGMAAWQMKDYAKAASLFGQLVSFDNEDKWLTASAAYWAYRANMKLGRKQKAQSYLHKAAGYKLTFYGILARSQLGMPVEYDWKVTPHFNNLEDKSYQQELLKSPTIRRAILLLEAGEPDLAEDDLRKNYRHLDVKQKELVMFLSSQYSLANLGLLIADGLKDYAKRRNYDGFLYPYPNWKPEGGWKVNRSWVWALVRQESLFSPKVSSHAGACGLMQLMPTTAANVTKNNEYKKGCGLLFDKKNNLNIGQRYVDILLNDENIGNNLFFLAASYNGGPHNVKKWADRKNYNNDPLLFVEMIPWRETRLYVKKVVANYWIYNSRRGLQSRSLKQLEQGNWPQLD
uniref:Lytic transglycosylase n=1 Tax=uncultured Alphaproteobacteria bacterium TaxID=91750 RepID=A0A6G8F305_9PROT|nr:lytic transglycosylase [uncultured Alphaproteobacteria bacterium]